MNVAVAKVESDSTTFNIEAIRREFPILKEASEKNSVHFLDSGASAQKPDYVLKKMDEMYKERECFLSEQHFSQNWTTVF